MVRLSIKIFLLIINIMKVLEGNNILLIVGLVFLAISTVHPIDHIDLNDQSEQIECQLCNNDASQPLKTKSLDSNYYLSSILITEIRNKFISTNSKDFQSRAPPKI